MLILREKISKELKETITNKSIWQFIDAYWDINEAVSYFFGQISKSKNLYHFFI